MGLFLPGLNGPNSQPAKKYDFSDPQGRKVVWVVRRPYSNTVTLFFSDGSSDLGDHSATRNRLFREGVKDPDKILDWVWNFYEAKVVITDPTAKQPTKNDRRSE